MSKTSLCSGKGDGVDLREDDMLEIEEEQKEKRRKCGTLKGGIGGSRPLAKVKEGGGEVLSLGF